MSRWHLYRQYLSWQLFPISWIAQLLLTKFWPNFLVALIFSHQNSFWHKNVLDPNFLGTNFLDPKFFRLKKVVTKLFWTQNFFDSKLFQDNFKEDLTSTKLSSTQLGTTQPQLVNSTYLWYFVWMINHIKI